MVRLKVFWKVIVSLLRNKEYIFVTCSADKLTNKKDEIMVYHNMDSKKYWFYCTAMEQAALRDIDGIYDLAAKAEGKERWN